MGFIKPTPLPMPAGEFVRLPFRDRLKVATTNWVDHGFGTPRVLNIVYVLKMCLFLLGGIAIASWTSAGVSFTEPGTWIDNIVVYQKLAVWLMLLEVVGLGGAFGPLCGHFAPMIGNIRFWIRPGTLRMRPWRAVPLTGGDERTVVDVVLFLAVLASLALPLAVSAEPVPHVPVGTGPQELIPAWTFVPVLVTMPLMGLRDKVIFLAARSEQYLPIMLFSAIFGGIALGEDASAAAFVTVVVLFKIIICIVWIGAGVSKIGEHFINVVPPMVSNTPGQPRFVKRLHYRNPPEDIRPSKLAWFMAHIGGTTAEIVVPVILLVTTNNTVATLGALFMLAFHLFITSTFPLAVPLEWNVYFGFVALLLWGGFGGTFDASTYNVWDLEQPLILLPVFALLLFFPVLGTIRPDLVSFLPSMRQYAGNWASATWLMRPGVEKRLNELPLVEPQVDQLQRMRPMPYAAEEAEMTVQLTLGWRAMHSQGRGLYSVALQHLDDIDERTIRDGEFVCSTILGWNFGDGHLHDDRLVAAVQKRLDLAPGDLVVVWCESQPMPWTKRPQHYRVIDAALGVVERGTWSVHDCVRELPWLPNGPVPTNVTWTAPGYQRQGAPG